MWNKTRATDLLKIQYPIIQGPFGGRFSSVKLLSTVSNLGGLGSFGLNSYHPEEILEVGQQIKESTSNPYNLNLWVPLENDPVYGFDVSAFNSWKEQYSQVFSEQDVELPEMPSIKKPIFDEQVEAILEVAPPVASFIFGLPSYELLYELRKRGTIIIGAATTLEEALILDEAPIDLIVATGLEAGGHRPSFLKSAEDSLVSTSALIREILGQVKKPIIAAGGISDGKDIHKYLKLGASAVQLGTAFLATDESGASIPHKERLLSPGSFQTELSRLFSGRLARTITNDFRDRVNGKEAPTYAPYPLQSQLLSRLMKKVKEENRYELVPFWAGQPSSLLVERSAERLFRSLVDQVEDEDV